MNFYSEYSFLYIVFPLIIAITLSYLYYKKSHMPVRTKIFLIILRTSGIFFILILLFIFYITLTEKHTEKPINIFLIDNSLSITLENRKEELSKSLELVKDLKNSKSENKFYLFAGDIINETDINDNIGNETKDADIGSTNLTKSINTIYKNFGENRISTINIISDGILNSGGNPLYSVLHKNALINYILIGDTIQKKDLSIKNIYFNPNSFAGSNTQIIAEFYSYDFVNPIKVNLYEDDKLIQEKDIDVNRDNITYNCTFTVKSNSTGIKKYTVELAKEPDEITDKNNREDFFIEYLDNKIKILVISGNPSPDFSYLHESLERINNFEVQFFTQKSPGVFYEGQIPSFDKYEILLLINYPNTATDINSLTKINDELKNYNMSVFFISGSNTDYEKVKMLKENLPFTPVSISGSDEKTPVKSVSNLHEDTKKIFGFSSQINNMPDIYTPGYNFLYNSGIQTVLYSGRISKPILFFTKNNNRNSAALLGYNFYKWRLNNGYNEDKDLLTEILSGSVLSIIDKEKNKRIYIETGKQVYSQFELIKINGFVNSNEPFGEYDVKLQIYNNTFTKDINVTKTSGKNFTGEITNLTKGEYFIKSTLMQDGKETGNDIKKILISEPNTEFKETKADNSILSILSGNSGGMKIDKNDIDELNKKLELKNEEDIVVLKKSEKVFLNSSIILLLAVIIIISVEWFIRKRLNLP